MKVSLNTVAGKAYHVTLILDRIESFLYFNIGIVIELALILDRIESTAVYLLGISTIIIVDLG